MKSKYLKMHYWKNGRRIKCIKSEDSVYINMKKESKVISRSFATKYFYAFEFYTFNSKSNRQSFHLH